MLDAWSARVSQPDDWHARHARELWVALGPIERQQVCSWIVPERVRQMYATPPVVVVDEAHRSAAIERMLGQLRLCALDAGYRVNLTNI